MTSSIPSRRIRSASFFAILAASGLALSACGGNATETATDASGSGDAGATSFTLSMHIPNVEESDPATWSIIQAFEEANPDVTVNVEGQAVDEHEQAMQVAAQSGNLPEVFWIYNSLASQMEEEGYLLDLGQIVDPIRDTFPENMLSGYVGDDGVQYGVPYQALVTGLFVNTAILEEHGLEVPTTFDELLNVAEALSADGVTTIAQGANGSSYSVWAFLTMLDRFGFEDKIDGILAGEESYNNEDFLTLYTHIQELAEAGAFSPNVATQDYVQAVSEFTSGNAAMLDAGAWATAEIQSSDIGDDVVFWAGPTFADGVGDQQIFMNAPSAPFVVSAEVADDPAVLDAVTRFIQFYYSDEGQQFLVDAGQTPVTNFQPEVSADATVFASILATLSQDGWTSPEAQPDLVVSSETASAMYDSIYGVIQGVFTPEQALETVQATINQ